jgi:adenylate cyclase, class 2
METEIEAKFPDINSSTLRLKLKKIGAILEHQEVLMKRKTFDYADRRLNKIGGWVRVRDEGNKITLSYKQLDDRSLHGTKEVTVNVDNFDYTCVFLENIGLKAKSYQETKREKWKYNDVEITIDTWPWIPTFVELEGATEKLVKETADKLDLDWSTVMHGSVEPVYQMHYDFTDEEIDKWESITFSPPPKWLLEKKKY